MKKILIKHFLNLSFSAVIFLLAIGSSFIEGSSGPLGVAVRMLAYTIAAYVVFSSCDEVRKAIREKLYYQGKHESFWFRHNTVLVAVLRVFAVGYILVVVLGMLALATLLL